MAGMEFEYDEEGSTFYFFLLSFWILVMVPSTYYLWPTSSSSDDQDAKRRKCMCAECITKRKKLEVKTSWKNTRKRAIQVGLLIGWLIFVLLVYKVSMIKMDYTEYDPFQILQIDREATDRDIKRAYHKLSLKIHPDKAEGDSKMFMRVAKAYAALTDEESKKNWIETGNPDGPGVPRFGIALPSWIIDDKNSTWVLFVYILIFMVIMPIVVGVWWYRSIKFSKDEVLLNTTRLYLYFFSKNTNMLLKKLIMVLGASFEFDKSFNPEVVLRPSDNEEVPKLMKQLPNLDEKNKEKPLCYGYSVKARALLHAHFARLDLPPDSLVIDQRYILKKCPALLNEMISVSSQLVASAMARQRPHEMPRLETIENCMKLAPMIIQAVDSKALPLMQLPHIRPEMLRHFINRKRNIQHISELVAMKDADRRDLLRSLNEVEYQNVMNVCASYPNIKMDVKSEVLDDEDNTVTAGSIVTVTVKLTRTSMMEGQEFSEHPILSIDEPEVMDNGDEENEEAEEAEDGGASNDAAAKETKPKAWQKQTKAKKKGGKKEKAKKSKQQVKKPVQNIGAKAEGPEGQEGESAQNEGDENGADDYVTESEEEEETVKEEEEEEVVNVKEKPAPTTTRRRKRNESEASNDDDWEKYQEENKKETTLEAKKRESQIVHCPFFPDEKHEFWWLYVADRKNRMLISAPVTIYTLKTTEEVQLKFSAPDRVGVYTYSVNLRSDSYHLDFDQVKNIKLDVKPARIIDDHPQWDISDDEDELNLQDQEASDSEMDSDYLTDD